MFFATKQAPPQCPCNLANRVPAIDLVTDPRNRPMQRHKSFPGNNPGTCSTSQIFMYIYLYIYITDSFHSIPSDHPLHTNHSNHSKDSDLKSEPANQYAPCGAHIVPPGCPPLIRPPRTYIPRCAVTRPRHPGTHVPRYAGRPQIRQCT